MDSQDHYATLKCSRKASAEAIRSAYKSLSLSAHPDKLRVARGSANESALRAAAQDQWSRIEHAHEVLSDPVTRGFYDISMEFVEASEAEYARIQRIKRKQAAASIATMEETVAANRNHEEKNNGLLLLTARYGDLHANELQQSSAVSAAYIDVTVPLQCLVHDSKLLIEQGGKEKWWLEGFYDPSMGAEDAEPNRLYIRYRFLDMIHEAEFSDTDDVRIPMQEHLISDAQDDAAPISARTSVGVRSTSSTSRRAAEARKKAMRRTILFGSIIAIGIGAYTLRKRGVTMASAQASVTSWAEWMQKLVADRVQQWSQSARSLTAPKPAAAASTPSTRPPPPAPSPSAQRDSLSRTERPPEVTR